MASIERRTLLRTSAAAAAAALAGGPALAQSSPRPGRRQGPARFTARRGAEGAARRARHPHRGPLRRHGARVRDPPGRPPRGGAHAAELGRRRGRRLGPGRPRPCREGAAALLRAPAGGPLRPDRAPRRAPRRPRQRHLVPRARLRRHPPQDHHPPRRPGRRGADGLVAVSRRVGRRFHDRPGARLRDRVPHGQFGLSRTLRQGLAHHPAPRACSARPPPWGACSGSTSGT